MIIQTAVVVTGSDAPAGVAPAGRLKIAAGAVPRMPATAEITWMVLRFDPIMAICWAIAAPVPMPVK